MNLFSEDLCKGCKRCEQFLHVEDGYDPKDFKGIYCTKKPEKLACHICIGTRDDIEVCGRDGKWFEKGKPSKKIIRKLKIFRGLKFDPPVKCGSCDKKGSKMEFKLSFTEINDPGAKPCEFIFCDAECLYYWISQYPKILRWD